VPTLRFASVDASSFAGDREEVAAALAAAVAQVAVVHHAPHLARWRARSAALARAAGLVVVGGGRRAGANLVLSALSVDFGSVHDVPFRRDPFRPAGAAVARLRRAGTGFAVAGVSFGAGSPAGDAALLRAALSEAAGLPLVASVLGDVGALADLGTVVGGRVVVGPSVAVHQVETEGAVVVEIGLPEG
jgi:hypothetical protein